MCCVERRELGDEPDLLEELTPKLTFDSALIQICALTRGELGYFDIEKLL